MENRTYALWVGSFTLVLGGLVLAAFWWFAGGSQATTEYLIISARSVTGLNPQAAVRFKGVRVGKVREVDLQDSREVFITIDIDSEVPVTRGTVARVGFQGLTGQGFIQLDDEGRNPAPPRRLSNGVRLIPMQAGLLDQAADAGQAIMGRLKTASERVENLLSEDNLARIDTTLKNLASSSEKLDKSLAQTAGLARDLRRFSSPENAERLGETLEQFRQVSRDLGPAVEDFRKALARVEAAGGRIDKLGARLQDGLGDETIPRVNALLGELQTSSRQLNRVLDDLERSPQQLLLGKHSATPGPGETEAPTP